MLEQSYYDKFNSKSVDTDYRRAPQDKPQLITNLNNLNYQNNYNTINQSSAKDILYELKQYDNFANNSNHINFNSYVTDRQSSLNSYNAGSNYSQNILNYNNSYYKINNINYIKNKSSSASLQLDSENRQNIHRRIDEHLLNDKMEREVAVECTQLVNNNQAEGKNITVHNFTSHNISHVNSTLNNFDDEEHHNQDSNSHNSQHFTQVDIYDSHIILL